MSATSKRTLATPGLGCLLARRLDEPRTGIDAEHRPVRADDPRQVLGGVAEPAPDVENTRARLGRVSPQGGFAVGAEAVGDDVAELDEAIEERTVPGLDGFLVCR